MNALPEDPYERALLRAAAIMEACAGNVEELMAVEHDARRRGVVKVIEILDTIDDPRDMKLVAQLLGVIGTWGICYLVPKAMPGVDPVDWIDGYVVSSFRIVDERG